MRSYCYHIPYIHPPSFYSVIFHLSPYFSSVNGPFFPWNIHRVRSASWARLKVRLRLRCRWLKFCSCTVTMLAHQPHFRSPDPLWPGSFRTVLEEGVWLNGHDLQVLVFHFFVTLLGLVVLVGARHLGCLGPRSHRMDAASRRLLLALRHHLRCVGEKSLLSWCCKCCCDQPWFGFLAQT